MRDCDANQRCVSGSCKGSNESAGQLGDSCAATSECGSGLTCEVAASGFPNGFCTVACATGACGSGACAGLASGATCAPLCTSDNDCRTGYGCCPGLGSVCVPNGACLPGACVRTVATSPLPSAQVIALGTHKVGEQLSFNVPAGTASLTIVHQAKLAGLEVVFQGSLIDNSAVPSLILKPDGSKAFDRTDPAFNTDSSSDGGVDPSGQYSMFSLYSPSTAAFTIPNTSASLTAGVPAGTWKFVVNDFAYECSARNSGCSDGGVDTDTYDLSVLLKPAPTANIDLAFYIVGDATTNTGQTFTHINAPTDPSAQRMVQTMTSVYSAQGINVRNVNWYDVSATDKTRFGTHISADLTGPCDELNQMFTLSSAHPGNTVNLFLVQAISAKSNGGGTVVGIDGTIPGPASLSGTVHSGAAVSLSDLFAERAGSSGCIGPTNIGNCGADEVAFTAAHETGHFLGLFHPTEEQGRDFDPLTDTGKCPCALCAAAVDRSRCDTQTQSNPVVMSGPLCAATSGPCMGGDNLMFWQLSSTSKGTVSPQQAAIMMRSPALQ
ncbi:MAG: hypothetical protein E6J88_03175 [Deltaproteobacteria bacterium]|nr:MAG: hypothetical protein E6J88_03175 [Deltaproteobacteria bacterium]